MPAATIQTSYNGGEISPRMMGRVDQAIYSISVEEMTNFVPTPEGPAMKRSGFRYIRAAMATASWLATFIYSNTQAYAIEMGEAAWRFFTNGGQIETAPGVAYEVAVPYTAAEAPAVWTQQSYDRLYLAHPAHPPAALTRTAATTFGHAALVLKNGPFADQNSSEAVTATVTGTLTVGGTATVTISGATPFLPGHVGANIMVECKDFSDIVAWEPQMKIAAAGDRRRSDGKAYSAQAGPTYPARTGTIVPTHIRGIEWDGQNYLDDINTHGPFGVPWRYDHDHFGVGTITAVGSPTTATVTVTRAFPSSLATIPSHRFRLPALSAATSWPKIVLLAFNRLLFFTDFEIIGSAVADYGGGSVNMAPFNEDGDFTADMGFRQRLDIANPILWAQADRDGILIGTPDGEYSVQKINAAQPFAGDNIECVRQSEYGSAPVRPVQAGVSTLFVQRSGRKIREANFEFANDRYVAPNINVWQRHILNSGARQLAFQREPDELLWAVRGDGRMVLHPHVPEQEEKGFAQVQHGGGNVISAITIPSDDGTIDELWALVDDGSGHRSIEQQAPSWVEGETTLPQAFFVDSGVTITSPGSTTLTGATWLAGKEVAILADGGVLPRQIVAGDGSIPLPLDAPPGIVTIGRPFTARLKTLRPELRGPNGGTVQGKRKRIASIMLRVLDTVGIKVDPGNGRLEGLIDRAGNMAMDAPIPPFTGDTTNRSIGGPWEYEGRVTIVSDDPLPAFVVADMPTITMEGV